MPLAVPHVQSSFVPDDDLGFPFVEADSMGSQGPVEVELLPNPDFVFPARPLDSPPARPLQPWNVSNNSSRSNQQNPISQPPTSRQRQRPSVSTLPAFTFNPSATLQTPPHSPGLTTPTSPVTPSRAMGHRRGGSEFIGGDGVGGTGLLSTSPTKGKGVLPPPQPSKPTTLGAPPPGRRGHAHRRSGAVSVHDIQTILQPKDVNAQARAGSAPTTPMETEQKPFFESPSHARRATSETCLRGSLEQPAASESSRDSTPPRRPVSARRAVGFADRVEYIRPLSTISSETESSLSTVRGHSVTGSLSSVISAGASSPPSARIPRTSLSMTVERDELDQRPRTASDVLDAKSKSKEGLGILTHLSPRPRSANGSPKEAPSTPTGDKSPKRKSFGWWDHKSAPKRPILPTSSSDPALMSSLESPLPSPDFPPNDCVLQGDSQIYPDCVHKLRRPRKVKSWASAIISRKPKPQHTKPKTQQDQPAIDTHANLKVEDAVAGLDFEPDFDADNTVTILSTPSPKRPRPRYTSESSPSKLWKTSPDDESASPVIDLDAALGPFNTPSFGPNARQPRHPPRARHSMSSMSAQAHRRTESAPELAPFEHRASKKPTSLMEEVFEEEDEDAYERQKTDASSPSIGVPSPEAVSDVEEDEIIGMGIHIVERNSQEVAQSPWQAAAHAPSQPKPNNLVNGLVSITPAEFSRRSVSPFSMPVREPTPVEVVEAEEEPRASSLTKDSDSTITPSISPDGSKDPQPLMTLSLPMPQHSVMTPDTLSGSSFSGRDFTASSLASIDTPRLGTATSSGTENRSVTFGEPGPEVRMSYEDVPSLTSSRSTMTSPAQNPWARPTSAFIPDDPRSMSFSLPPRPNSSRKRSSIASLSRLIGGGSFGERSKLSIESRPQSQHSTVSNVQEKRKSKRLSKLVNFFRPKQSGSERS